MYTIFWLGNPFFSPALTALGCKVVHHNFCDASTFGWDDIIRLTGAPPDIVVVADKSRPPFVRGIETFPCFTVFLCVDSHIHSWYPYYAQGFDLCLVSLRDHLPLFENMRLSHDDLLWSPAFAKDHDLPATATPQWDVLFVGTVNKETTPKRSIFLKHLQSLLPGRLHITTGDYRALYPKGRVVLNYCEHGDLNFRVFEAMGCGSCLLTPDIANGQPDLFTNGVHFRTYPPNDVHAAAHIAKELLEAPDEIRTLLRQNGLQAVNSAHRATHRATKFLEQLCRTDMRQTVQKRLANAPAIHQHYLRFLYLLHAEASQGAYLRSTYLNEAQRYAR